MGSSKTELTETTTTIMDPSPYTIGLPENGLVPSKVLKPPGGMTSNIFSETDSVTSSNESRASSASPKTPQKVYKMASNFELGDEQPENPLPRRKPFKPSVNPLTGQLIGCPGVVVPEEKKPVVTNRATRVPPGGYSTPLW